MHADASATQLAAFIRCRVVNCARYAIAGFGSIRWKRTSGGTDREGERRCCWWPSAIRQSGAATSCRALFWSTPVLEKVAANSKLSVVLGEKRLTDQVVNVL